jgi:hypothetical protein
MRSVTVALLGALVLALAGCNHSTPGDAKPADNKPGSGGSKLAEQMVGTWAKDNASYDFKKDGTFEYKGGDLTYRGKYRALDDKTIEEEYDLTAEQAKLIKELVWEPAKKIYDAIPDNPLLKKDPWDWPEPKEGKNTAKVKASVAGDKLTLGGAEYTKKK